MGPLYGSHWVYTNNIPTGMIFVRVSYEYLPNVIHTYIIVLPYSSPNKPA
jgi:hypothetical protein